MTAYALKCALPPNLPNNEGIFRRIEVAAPEGSIVNPRFPASVGGRMATGHYLPFAVFGCLGQIVPERVMAAWGSPMWSMIQTGVRANGATYANVLFFNGGMGGNTQRDGVTCSLAVQRLARPRSRSASTSRRCASITRSCAPTAAAPAAIAAGSARRS